MTGIQDNSSYIPDYLDTQAEDRFSTDANHVSGDSFKSRRSGSTPSLTGSGVSNPSIYPVSSTPVNLPLGTNISQSNSSGRSSRGTTPPAPSFRKGKGSHSSGQGSDNSRSSHSKSPKQYSLTDASKPPGKDLSFECGPSSEISINDGEKDENSIRPSPNLNMKRSTSHNSKLSNAGYNPSGSSFTSANSDKLRSKKKSWINNALNPTYTSRCEDFRRNFPTLPAEEMLLGDYSCALQKDILVHGRIFVTINFLCFYANIFKWETAVTIRWKEITAMTKEKTALVIPNAIQICTGAEKLFFCSFSARDKAHMMLFRVWQNALMDSPASQPDLWVWVNSVYGERTSSRISDVDNDMSNDGVSNNSFDGLELQFNRPRLHSNIQEELEENKLAINEGSFLPDRVGNLVMKATSNKSMDSLPTDLSDNSESETGNNMLHRRKPGVHRSLPTLGSQGRPGIFSTDILTYEVWRQSKKDAREILNRNFKFNIDDLFTLLFTNSKFFYDFQAERNTFDIVQCPWQQAETSDEKFRKVEFTLNLNHAMGPKTSRATEVQTMRSTSVPGHIYSVDVETTNADVPYGDTFFVLSHYCLVKVTDDESRFTVLCDIKYRKSPWALVKTFIEKNVWAGIDDHYVALSSALDREIVERKDERKEEDGLAGLAGKKKLRRQRKRKVSTSDTGPVPVLSTNARIPKYNVSPKEKEVETGSSLNLVLMLMLSLLCFLNIYLLYRIWGLESTISLKMSLLEDYVVLDTQGPRTSQDWLNLLQRQEAMHNKDLRNWQKAVNTASGLLQQTENVMSSFSKNLDVKSTRNIVKHILEEQERIGRSHHQQKHLKILHQQLPVLQDQQPWNFYGEESQIHIDQELKTNSNEVLEDTEWLEESELNVDEEIDASKELDFTEELEAGEDLEPGPSLLDKTEV